MLRHSKWNRAFVVVREADGKRRQIMLGEWGSAKARRAYADIVAKYATVADAAMRAADLARREAADVTVGGLCARYLTWAENYYVSHVDGEPTGEHDNMELAAEPLLHLYADEPARDFTLADLRRVRESLIAVDEGGRPLARQTVNDRINRIRRLFRWGAENGYVDPATWHALQALSPIRFGRDKRLRETEPRRPVSEAVVLATLPHLPAMLADVVAVQLLIGCRPGEILRACTREIDRTGAVWLFAPTRAKMGYRRKVLPYAVGPRAQEILSRYLRLDADAPLFQPAASEAERHAEQRAARKTPVQPSQRDRRRPCPARVPGQHYDAHSYRRAIQRAAVAAGVEAWSPHQLRHLAATLARKRAGAEVARCVLAHGDIDSTAIYAEADVALAKDYASKHG